MLFHCGPGQAIACFCEFVSEPDFVSGMRKFAIALPTQRTEAILEGMSQAFEFFGCVPKEVWWDDPRTAADAVLTGRKWKINSRYAALASHFASEPLFCRPAAMDHSNVYRQWKLPTVFLQLRERLEDRHGARAGVRVLQLQASHPVQRVQSAVEQLRGPDGADADCIIRRVEGSAHRARDSAGKQQETSPAKSSLQDEGPRDEALSVCRGRFELLRTVTHVELRSVSRKRTRQASSAGSQSGPEPFRRVSFHVYSRKSWR